MFDCLSFLECECVDALLREDYGDFYELREFIPWPRRVELAFLFVEFIEE